MIPIERITVLNPRERNKRVFGDIVTNIAHLGLKRPITVTGERIRIQPRRPAEYSGHL